MKMSIRALLTLFTALVAFSQAAFAVVYPLPPKDSRLVGENIQITVPEDSKLPLESFAAQYQMGLSNMLEANPGVDPFLPKAGSTLTIPQQLILPDAPREGIIINSAEMRLYYYPKGPTPWWCCRSVSASWVKTPAELGHHRTAQERRPNLDADRQDARRICSRR